MLPPDSARPSREPGRVSAKPGSDRTDDFGRDACAPASLTPERVGKGLAAEAGCYRGHTTPHFRATIMNSAGRLGELSLGSSLIAMMWRPL